MKKEDLIIEGHRAWGIFLPENTLEAFQKAADNNIDSVETDVWFTSDRVPIICHGDNRLGYANLISDKDNKLYNILLCKISYIDLQDYRSNITKQRIPSLSEVLKIIMSSSITKINIELKCCFAEIIP